VPHPVGVVVRLQSALRKLPSEAVFSGLTAAWIHGLDVDPRERLEVMVPKRLGITTRSGMVIRRCSLAVGDIVKRRGFAVTSPLRTLLDLSGRLSVTESVVIADMALHAKLVSLQALRKSIESYEGVWGVKRLRRVVLHVEPASESPMETRLRMLLVVARLPRPQAQVPIHDRSGRFLGRRTSTTPTFGSPLNTTAKHIEARWSKTTAARIAWSRPGSACFASPPPTCTTPLRPSSL
jgi:transcriptional regulator with AbiEi antitoxin domain of type IV toxin-antitoxin system